MRQFALRLSARATGWGDEDRRTRQSRDLADGWRRDRDDQSNLPAASFCDKRVALNRRIGEAGLPLIVPFHRTLCRPVDILAQCNAGWIATVDCGAATAPISMAHDRGVRLRVFVDNAGGPLRQRGQIDLVIAGGDRIDRRLRRRRVRGARALTSA